ncbi:hypothetical protein [Spirosoma montaniterrae]|nr:hypothetical protein [Spirosoma montaniterrae]
MNPNAVLLLTGTVNPNGMVLTEIQDTEVRKRQYIESIKFWLKKVSFPIVFVENSNNDLSDYFSNEIGSGKIEILYFNGNNYDKRLGKGLGELNCIEYATLNSSIIKNAGFVFKVTGRYKVINFHTFLSDYESHPDVDIMVDFKWNLTFCDSRFFGFKPSFVADYFSSYKETLNDSTGVYLEHALSKAALTAIANTYTFRPLITLPRIEGYSASSGTQYNSSYLHWFRYKFEYWIKYRSFGLGNLPWI